MTFTKRTILGVHLLRIADGMWRISTNNDDRRVPSKWWGTSFIHHGTTRLGTRGERYTMQRWGNPANDRNQGSLKSAVREFLRALSFERPTPLHDQEPDQHEGDDVPERVA